MAVVAEIEPGPRSQRRRDGLLFLLALPTAITVISRVSDAIDIDNALLQLAKRWKDVLELIWSDVFTWLSFPIRLTETQAACLTYATLIATSGFISSTIQRVRRQRPEKISQAAASSLGLLYLIFFWPSLPTGNSADVLMIMTVIHVVYAICLSLIFYGAGEVDDMGPAQRAAVFAAIGVMLYIPVIAQESSPAPAEHQSVSGVVTWIALIALVLSNYLIARLDANGLIRVVVAISGLVIAGLVLQLIPPLNDYLVGLLERAADVEPPSPF